VETGEEVEAVDAATAVKKEQKIKASQVFLPTVRVVTGLAVLAFMPPLPLL
jgi:hypothetical protein